jgi:hypothetical protein
VRLRVLISLAIGVATGTFCWFVLAHFRLGAGDFNGAAVAAQDLLAQSIPATAPSSCIR